MIFLVWRRQTSLNEGPCPTPLGPHRLFLCSLLSTPWWILFTFWSGSLENGMCCFLKWRVEQLAFLLKRKNSARKRVMQASQGVFSMSVNEVECRSSTEYIPPMRAAQRLHMTTKIKAQHDNNLLLLNLFIDLTVAHSTTLPYWSYCIESHIVFDLGFFLFSLFALFFWRTKMLSIFTLPQHYLSSVCMMSFHLWTAMEKSFLCFSCPQNFDILWTLSWGAYK